jgi:hypothetical protein
MSPFLFALIASAVITVCLLVLKGKDNNETNNSYGLKVFPVTFIVIFVCYSYMIGGDGALAQEIDIGEPPF